LLWPLPNMVVVAAAGQDSAHKVAVSTRDPVVSNKVVNKVVNKVSGIEKPKPLLSDQAVPPKALVVIIKAPAVAVSTKVDRVDDQLEVV